MKVTITEKHLKKAINARQRGARISITCLVAQAAKEVYGAKFNGCSEGWMCFKSGKMANLGKKASGLITLFDGLHYAAILEKLPSIVHFPDLPQ